MVFLKSESSKAQREKVAGGGVDIPSLFFVLGLKLGRSMSYMVLWVL
jgi:hypothetical protein